MRDKAVGAAVRLSLLPFAFGLSLAGSVSVASAATVLTIPLTFDSTCPSPSFSGGVISCGGGVVPPVPPSPPPTSPPPPPPGGGGTPGGAIPATCGTLKVINMGDVTTDGVPVFSSGFDANTIAIARLTIPYGLTTTKSNVSVYQGSGGGTYQTVWISKNACDFAPTYPYSAVGPGVNLYFTAGGALDRTMSFSAGDVWFIQIRNINAYGKSSCSSTCEAGIKVYKPN